MLISTVTALWYEYHLITTLPHRFNFCYHNSLTKICQVGKLIIFCFHLYCQVLVRWMPKILSKNTFYRFFNSVKTNWLRFISLLAFDIVNNNLKELTDDKIKNVFIIDDSLFNRTSCKKQNCGQRFLTTPICISKKFLGYLA